MKLFKYQSINYNAFFINLMLLLFSSLMISFSFHLWHYYHYIYEIYISLFFLFCIFVPLFINKIVNLLIDIIHIVFCNDCETTFLFGFLFLIVGTMIFLIYLLLPSSFLFLISSIITIIGISIF